MKEHAELTLKELTDLQGLYIECLTISHDIFGAKTFKIRTPEGKWQMSVPLYDSVMVAVERLQKKAAKLVASKKKILASLEQAFAKEESYAVIVGKPNTADAVKERLTLIYDLIEKHA